VRGEIARDEPILDHRLFPKDLTGTPGIMSLIVPPGKRAMAVGVNEVIGVSGFILPKDRVDVIATKTDQGASKSTETILQNIEVLAVGKRVEQVGKENIEVPTVTMAVTPQQAERLARALQEGKIHIALRSIMDTQVADLPTLARPTAVARRRIAARPAVAETRGSKALVVDVIRGDKRTLETHALE
jgi:pilus assembly protein CpaB